MARFAEYLVPDERGQHLARAYDILETEIERGQPEAYDIGIAEIADHPARDQRLADRMGIGVAKADMAPARGRVARADARQPDRVARRRAHVEQGGHRKSVGAGKSVAVSVDLGGGGRNKKK